MTMKMYIVLWQDSHTDTIAHPFFDLEEAKKWAMDQAVNANKKYHEDIKETPIDGWLYHVEYSCEGDCLWITEHEIITERCAWKDTGEYWESSCGLHFSINDGTPAENEMKYCTKCMKEIVE